MTALALVRNQPEPVMLADSTVTLPALPDGAQVRFQVWAGSPEPFVMVRHSDEHEWVPAGLTVEVYVENTLPRDAHSDDPWQAS